MDDKQKMYTHLFSRVCDAIKEIEFHNYGTAKRILIEAQLECEEMYMDGKISYQN